MPPARARQFRQNSCCLLRLLGCFLLLPGIPPTYGRLTVRLPQAAAKAGRWKRIFAAGVLTGGTHSHALRHSLQGDLSRYSAAPHQRRSVQCGFARCSVFCPDRWLCSFSPDLKAFLIAKFAVLLFHKLYDNPATLTDTLHKRVYQFGLSLQLCFHTSIR